MSSPRWFLPRGARTRRSPRFLPARQPRYGELVMSVRREAANTTLPWFAPRSSDGRVVRLRIPTSARALGPVAAVQRILDRWSRPLVRGDPQTNQSEKEVAEVLRLGQGARIKKPVVASVSSTHESLGSAGRSRVSDGSVKRIPLVVRDVGEGELFRAEQGPSIGETIIIDSGRSQVRSIRLLNVGHGLHLTSCELSTRVRGPRPGRTMLERASRRRWSWNCRLRPEP